MCCTGWCSPLVDDLFALFIAQIHVFPCENRRHPQMAHMLNLTCTYSKWLVCALLQLLADYYYLCWSAKSALQEIALDYGLLFCVHTHKCLSLCERMNASCMSHAYRTEKRVSPSHVIEIQQLNSKISSNFDTWLCMSFYNNQYIKTVLLTNSMSFNLHSSGRHWATTSYR